MPQEYLNAPIVGNPDGVPGMPPGGIIGSVFSPAQIQAMLAQTGEFEGMQTTATVSTDIDETVVRSVMCDTSCTIECKTLLYRYGGDASLGKEWMTQRKRKRKNVRLGDPIAAEYARTIADYLNGKGDFTGRGPQHPTCGSNRGDLTGWGWTRAKEAVQKLVNSSLPSTTDAWLEVVVGGISEPCTVHLRVCILIISLVPSHGDADDLNKTLYHFLGGETEVGWEKLVKVLSVVERGAVGIARLMPGVLCKALEKMVAGMAEVDAMNKGIVEQLAQRTANSIMGRWQTRTATYRDYLGKSDPAAVGQLRQPHEWRNLMKDLAQRAIDFGSDFLTREAGLLGLTERDKDEIWQQSFLGLQEIPDLRSDDWGGCTRVEFDDDTKYDPAEAVAACEAILPEDIRVQEPQHAKARPGANAKNWYNSPSPEIRLKVSFYPRPGTTIKVKADFISFVAGEQPTAESEPDASDLTIRGGKTREFVELDWHWVKVKFKKNRSRPFFPDEWVGGFITIEASDEERTCEKKIPFRIFAGPH